MVLIENTQNLLTQYRYAQEQRNLYQSQLELMNASLLNLQNTKSTLINIKEGVNNNDEILIPIGGLINIRATIKDTKNLLLFVGQDVVIEKDIDESITFIDKIIEQQNESIKFILERLQSINLALQSMGETIQSGMNQN